MHTTATDINSTMSEPQSSALSISEIISEYAPKQVEYEDLYRILHADPELSLLEQATAARVAQQLQNIGDFEIYSNIGGHGLIGVLRNGPGKTVLLRSELDALPVLENTNFPFASKKTMLDPADNKIKPVMHACGHDIHICAQLSASALLHASRKHWSGTLISLFQGDEENGTGAKAMVLDGLYDTNKFPIPKPDIALGGHVMPLRAGQVKTRPGVIGSSADSYLVTLYGRGGHGSRPQNTIDAVVLASSIVMKLQTIVSRMVDPREMAVVTVGSIHAGSAPNIIPGEATLQINTRAFSPRVRDRVLEAMKRLIDAECTAYNTPLPAKIEHIGSFPITYNDPPETAILASALQSHFGSPRFDTDAPISTGSEDFQNLTLPISIPSVFWNYGGIDPEIWDKAVEEDKLEEIPGNHSAGFAPILQPTLSTGMEAYAAAALAFLR